jgi:hypothetical protein
MALSGTAYGLLLPYLHGLNHVLLWFLTLLISTVIFFIPFFRWVVGTDFHKNGDGLSWSEAWATQSSRMSRTGIWFISGGTTALLLSLLKDFA